MMADEVLQQGVRSITDLMVMPGLINLDFADVRSVMGEMGKAMMGTGEGHGENRALEAAERAIANPLLDGVSMQGAKGVIISIIGGDDMKLLEVDEAANHIRELVDPNANIIWGSAFNPDLQGRIRVSVVATGIEQSAEMAEEASRPFNLGASRGPARPAVAAPEKVEPLFERAAAQPTPEPIAAVEPEPEPLDLTGMAQDNEAEAEGAAVAEVAEAATDADDDWGSPAAEAEAEAAEIEDEPFELSLEAPEGMGEPEAPASSSGDDLLGDASRLAEADEPVAVPLPGRRRGLVASGSESEGGDSKGSAGGGESADKGPRLPSAGNTLFERMANLSRGNRASDENEEDGDEGEGGGSSLSIPRFLGRQNNQ
jgi:cell division protein FtsZ